MARFTLQIPANAWEGRVAAADCAPCRSRSAKRPKAGRFSGCLTANCCRSPPDFFSFHLSSARMSDNLTPKKDPAPGGRSRLPNTEPGWERDALERIALAAIHEQRAA